MTLPTGTVTFLFTDIEGSTALWERDREAMQAALEQHDALLQEAIAARGGHVFKTVGDAFCTAFGRPGDALAAAVDIQRTLHAADWSMLGDDGPIRVRMGLHTGRASERSGDYFGPNVNRVARIEAAGHGGQVLLSRETRGLIEAGVLPGGCRLRDLGEHRLKDLLHSERITQLVVDGLPDITRDLRTVGELSAHDRIQVLEPHASPSEGGAIVLERSVSETLDTIEAALRRDSGSASLTAEQVIAAARHRPTDWREWRLGRVAEWSQPRYRLDGRFVDLTLLIDQGEGALQGRWQAQEEHYANLGALLADTPDPAIVVLGPPGSGKSTLLRHVELDLAIEGILARTDEDESGASERPVTFFVPLSTYAPAQPGDPAPAPGGWLSEQWTKRYPDLPPLGDLLAEGRVTFLLDALNEIPAPSEREFRERVQLWKGWLQDLVANQPGNRVVFNCRSLDYSQPLSTPDLRVPQVQIEPLSDEQVRGFLQLYSPGRWREVWETLEGSPQLAVVRSPYFLALLVDQVEASGELPEGRAGLFTGFVRQALRREVERGSPLFEPGTLLTSRDLRRIAAWKWKGSYDLPERGILLPKLAELAKEMQDATEAGGNSQVRVDLDEALELLDTAEDEAILAAGQALAMLDEDEAAEELMYIHQLVQEYFAARKLAKEPNPELVRSKWRAAEIGPTVEEVIEGLDPADPLPVLPQTGWEETTILAAAMANDPASFLRSVAEVNLALAGRAAAQPELIPRLPDDLLDELRWALVGRSRNAEADLRDRIACGYAVGDLGDPRFERHVGPDGEYLLPPLVSIPSGTYPIGADAPIEWAVPGAKGLSSAHIPRHAVDVADFRIGQFLVTNAEWTCFMEAGGYQDKRWWDTADARRWLRGELPNEAGKLNGRYYRKTFLANPDLFEQMVDEGRFPSAEAVEQWREWMALADDAFEEALNERWQGRRETEPDFWRDARFNHPSQPVVGIGWYEARAYCNWLAEQSGLPLRLPTEVEREAAAGGMEGRRFPWGDGEERTRANTTEACIRRSTPVGVFVEGDSPEQATDLGGNVSEWTTGLFGEVHEDSEATDFPYPYDPADGREDLEAAPSVRRVVRGGGWYLAPPIARAALRFYCLPGARPGFVGMRVAVTSSPSSGSSPPSGA